jgi:hypothetical protein
MLRQSGIRRIASIDIPEERSVRNIYQEDAFGQADASRAGADEASRPALSPAVAQLASLAERSAMAEREYARVWQQDDDQAKPDPTAKLPLDLRVSRAVRAGMSWLVTCMLEGFAVYAESMYPCFVDPARLNGDATGGDATGEHKLQPHRQTRVDDSVAWQFSDNPWLILEPQSQASKTSRIARFWSRMRRGRKASLTDVTLETLDERTLRDIGGDYPDIERIVRYQDPHTW